MSVDPKLLVRYASMKKEDREAMLDVAHRNDPLVKIDEAMLSEIMAGVAADRLAFADRRVALAQALIESLPGDEEMARRDAIVGAYDAIHHALRALHIAFEGWDPIGHQETLDATGELFGKVGGLGKRFDWIELRRPLPEAVSDLRTERQAAEWDVTNRDEEGNARLDYNAQASKAAKLAADVCRTVRAALYDHRAASL